MSAAREQVLGRIRTALGTPGSGAVEVPRAYRQAGAARGGAVELFCSRAADYLATVHRVARRELEGALAQACAARGSTSVVASPGASARIPTLAIVPDTPDIAAPALDGYDAALTGCALAIAETGTIVLDHGEPESGRRALTLVPDHHLCIVEASRIVAAVPDAIARLAPAAERGHPITFVSGPSATSDIELERVEGVHGPRKLDIFVVHD